MKETISNTSQRVTRSKTYPFDRIPLNLKEEILLKLKANSISKFITISKSWSSIICDRDFTNLYLARSSTRPRLLFTINHRDMKMQFFHSCSQDDPSYDHQRLNCYPQNLDNWYDFSPPVRGLISCINDDIKVMIGNPSTCQFITLPKVKTLKKSIASFFGYDPVNDVYKVLCMAVTCCRRGSREIVSGEHQVFTLGARQKWRKIKCKHPHFPPHRTQGICSNGVVYYLALTGPSNHVQSLICFDLGSENFSVIKLPRTIQFLVNYNKKIAVTNVLFDGTLDLWVLEDVNEQKWSKISIVVPHWTHFCVYGTYRLRGTLSNGELIFAPWCSPNPFFLLCYNLKEKKTRKIVIEGIEARHTSIEVFLDHVESSMILPKVK